MNKLVHSGADPEALFEQFRQANEERESLQEDTYRVAQQELTADTETIAEYRRRREAARFLVVESDLPIDEMSYHDYRATRLAQQRGERPASFASYQQKKKE